MKIKAKKNFFHGGRGKNKNLSPGKDGRMDNKTRHRSMPREPVWEKLRVMRNVRETGCMRTPTLRNFCDNVHIGCYVETGGGDGMMQHGVVTKIIRNRFGIPVALKVACSDTEFDADYIAVDRVTYYQLDADKTVPDFEYEDPLPCCYQDPDGDCADD